MLRRWQNLLFLPDLSEQSIFSSLLQSFQCNVLFENESTAKRYRNHSSTVNLLAKLEFNKEPGNRPYTNHQQTHAIYIRKFDPFHFFFPLSKWPASRQINLLSTPIRKTKSRHVGDHVPHFPRLKRTKFRWVTKTIRDVAWLFLRTQFGLRGGHILGYYKTAARDLSLAASAMHRLFLSMCVCVPMRGMPNPVSLWHHG